MSVAGTFLGGPVPNDEIEAWYRDLQTRLCDGFAGLDGVSQFTVDDWNRPAGGGGTTRILTGPGHIEKAAVNVSAVWGDTPPGLSEGMASKSDRFFATGISMIIHPRNPYAPTFHANLRFFTTSSTAWFGGGLDLTPYYLFEDDARHFHRTLAAVCDRHAIADYPAWKAVCDDYFFLRHRGEARGVGGIFFDHLTDRLDEVWAFQRDLGDHILDAYLPILEHRIAIPYGEREDLWQQRRRGRYVEFNLVWDRGTKFGLETGGRTESILASLPPRVLWDTELHPAPGTAEFALLDLVSSPPRSWV